MGKGLWARPWVRHIAVALGYGLIAALFRAVSFSEWMILAGLRLGVLLLVPYRYWPALVVGESGYFVYLSYNCISMGGVLWALFNSVPAIIFVAPVIYFVRRRWNPVHQGMVNVGRLLGCALLVSCVVTLQDALSIALMRHLPANYKIPYSYFMSLWLIGNYLGILTVTPLILFFNQLVANEGLRRAWQKALNSRLLLESFGFVVPAFALLFWIGMVAQPYSDTRHVVQVAVFFPVVWLALRHGWHGAAVGGAFASCAVVALMPNRFDQDTLQAESIVSFAISTMLLMGARIAALDRRAQQESAELREAFFLAQRNVYAGEMQLRMTSQALEQIRETVHAGFMVMMGRLRHLQPAIDERGYQRHALAAQEQLRGLAESLYPVVLRERGLPVALCEGPMVRMLRTSGLDYSCDLKGALSQLSHALRMTIYRIVWDAVADACMRKSATEIRVRVRVGERRGRTGVFISIHFGMQPEIFPHIRWEELASRIERTTSGLGLRAIQDRAAIFEGYATVKELPSGWRLNAFLLDPIQSGG